jgi:hypothetical protein
MAGQHRARSLARIGMAALAAAAVVVTGLVVNSGSAGAAVPLNTSCSARAAGINAPTPVSVAYANPANSPCVFDSVGLASVTATIIPGIPGITGANVALKTVQSSTSFASFAGFASTEAQTDVARLQVIAPGLILSATGVHSQAGANINPFCTGAASGESWLGSLTINGKAIPIANKPITINVGLRITINVNQTTGDSHSVTQRALFITFPDKRYSLVVGESHADLSCVSQG